MSAFVCASHREELGLRPLSAEDEEVIKMLLYGNEAAGVTGVCTQAPSRR